MTKKEVHVIIPLVEGDTEVEFYKKIRSILLNKHPKNGNYEFLSPINIKGIGNFKCRASRQFTHAVESFQKDQKKETRQKRQKNEPKIKYHYHAFMCIDTDVLDSSPNPAKFCQKPPINEEDTKKSIEERDGIPHFIKAVHSIEDWFLEDPNGIKKYLGISKFPKLSNNQSGAEKLTVLFKTGNKVYTKGTSCKNFVDYLDINLILSNHSTDFNDLVQLIK